MSDTGANPTGRPSGDGPRRDPLLDARRSQRLALLIVRLLFIVVLMTVTMLPFVATATDVAAEGRGAVRGFAWVFGATFVFGLCVLLVDALTPNKKLGLVFGVYMGIVAGLVATLAIGAIIDLVAESWELSSGDWPVYISLMKLAIGIAMCYLAVSLVLTTKDDVRLVIPYVEFAKQIRGVRPLLLDTSAIIDGRVDALGAAGFVDAPLVVPQFVVDELQALADSADKLKRARGRRGLEVVSELQANPHLDVSIDERETGPGPVDRTLVELAAREGMRILTTDSNLARVGQIRGVTVLNVNDVAAALKPEVIPGETLELELVKPGEGEGQGVGYLADGTMVVVEDGAGRIGETVEVSVTNSLQTSAGRMIFARAVAPEPTPARRLAEAATRQEPDRGGTAPARERRTTSRRNPRR